MDETNYRRVFTPGLKPDRLTRWQRDRQPVGSDKWAYYDAQLRISKLKRMARHAGERDPKIQELEVLAAELKKQFIAIQRMSDDEMDVHEKRQALAELKSDMRTINAAIKARRDAIFDEHVAHYDDIQNTYFETRKFNEASKLPSQKRITLRGIRKAWQRGEFGDTASAEKQEKDGKGGKDEKKATTDKGKTPDSTSKKAKDTKSKKDPSDMSEAELDDEIQKIKDKMITHEEYEAAKALLIKAGELDSKLEAPRKKIELYEKFNSLKPEIDALFAKKAEVVAKKTNVEAKFEEFDSADKDILEKYMEQGEKLREKGNLKNKLTKVKDGSPEKADLEAKLSDLQKELDKLDTELSTALGCKKDEIKTTVESTYIPKYKNILTDLERKGFGDADAVTVKQIVDEVKRVKDNLDKEMKQIEDKIKDKKPEIDELTSAGPIPTEEEYKASQLVVDMLEGEIADLKDETRGWDLEEAQRVYRVYKENHPEVDVEPEPEPDEPEPKKPLTLDDMRKAGMTEEDIQAILKGLGREAEYTAPTPDPSR